MPNDPKAVQAVQETQEFEIYELSITSEISGNKEDLSQLYERLIIRESIFKNYIHGEIHIFDTNSIISELPIVGEEKIKIKIGYPQESGRPNNEKIDLEFLIYKVDNRERQKLGQSIENYILYFCDKIALDDTLKRVSKTFKKETVSKYVETILKEDLNIDSNSREVEPTQGKYEVTIPNLNPITSINFLTKFSYNNEGNDSLFYFYQDRKGFKFKSLEKLISDNADPKKKIFFEHQNNYNGETDRDKQLTQNVTQKMSDLMGIVSGVGASPGTGDIVSKTLKSIQSGAVVEWEGDGKDTYQAEFYSIEKPFSNYESCDTGYFGFTNHSTDILTKTIHKIEYNYSENFGKMKKLNSGDTKSKKYEVIKNPFSTKIYSKPTTKGRIDSEYVKEVMKDKESDMLEDHFSETRDPLQNTKKERFFMGPKFNVKIPGNLELFLGDTVDCKFPSYKPEGDDRKREYPDDKYYSGKYMVFELTHTFTRLNVWHCDMLICSDTLKKSIG